VTRRLPVIVILAALVVAGFVLDGTTVGVDADDATPLEVRRTSFPMAPSPGAVTSTWFCAGGTADEESFAQHVVTMLNTSDAALDVDLTAFPGIIAPPAPGAAQDLDPDAEDGETEEAEEDDAAEDEAGEDEADQDEATEPGADVSREPVAQAVEIGPRSRVRVALSDLVTAPIASALVEAEGPGLVVEHEVSSIHGIDAKPCATAASSEWHFAWGTTAREAREVLVLFNPFPDDAIVEGVFSTEDTVREPGRFAGGLVVPARSTVGIDLGDDVTRRAEVAATLRTRAGRLVVDRIVRINEEGGDRGLTVQLGVPEAQQAWVFPDGLTAEAVDETFVVYNPGTELAEVEISFALDDPAVNGVPEPVDLSLPPGSHATVDMNEDGRLPPGIPHSTVVRSANQVPVVAERVVSARGEQRRGVSVTTGSPVEATEWTFAAGSTAGAAAESITIVNLDPQVLTEVEVVALVGGQELPISELQDIVIEAGTRLNIDLTSRIANRADLAIVVRATEPVVAERVLAQVTAERRGLSLAVGIPSPDGARVPPDPLENDAPLDLGDDLDDLPSEDDDGIPEAPDDVELPEPDDTIVVGDPDAEATDPDADAEEDGAEEDGADDDGAGADATDDGGG
jgi:hypothetical protein